MNYMYNIARARSAGGIIYDILFAQLDIGTYVNYFAIDIIMFNIGFKVTENKMRISF